MKWIREKIYRMMATVMFLVLLSQSIVFAEEAQNSAVNTTAVSLTSPSAILMEASTGTVLFEKNPLSFTRVCAQRKNTAMRYSSNFKIIYEYYLPINL